MILPCSVPIQITYISEKLGTSRKSAWDSLPKLAYSGTRGSLLAEVWAAAHACCFSRLNLTKLRLSEPLSLVTVESSELVIVVAGHRLKCGVRQFNHH